MYIIPEAYRVPVALLTFCAVYGGMIAAAMVLLAFLCLLPDLSCGVCFISLFS
jgi:hypothetical protein